MNDEPHARARVEIKLPADAVTIELVNDGPSIFHRNMPVRPDEDSHVELHMEGLICTEEAVEDADTLEMLRGSFVPTSIRVEVIG